MIDFNDILIDYEPNDADDDEMLAIKRKLISLPQAERNIFLIYLTETTYTGTARTLKCSVPTVRKKINEIRKKLI